MKHLGEEAPNVHLVIRNGSLSDGPRALALRSFGLRRVQRKSTDGRSIDQLVSGQNKGQSKYTGDWFIDGFEPTSPTAHSRGWRSSRDPILCVVYLVDDYPETAGSLRGDGPWIGYILHFAHTGPAGAVTKNMNTNVDHGGEEE